MAGLEAVLQAVLQAALHVDTQAGTLSVPMVGKLSVRHVGTQAGTLSVPLVGKLAELQAVLKLQFVEWL